MKKVMVMGILGALVLALLPGISRAELDAKLTADWKGASVEVSRTSGKKEEGKIVGVTCRVVAVYQKNSFTVFDEKKDADVDVNASKTFSFNFKQATSGSGRYYVIAIIKNIKSGAEMFKVAEVVSP